MRVLAVLCPLAALALSSCFFREGPGGEPQLQLGGHVQIHTIGVVVVETGNPEIPARRYAYESVEALAAAPAFALKESASSSNPSGRARAPATRSATIASRRKP